MQKHAQTQNQTYLMGSGTTVYFIQPRANTSLDQAVGGGSDTSWAESSFHCCMAYLESSPGDLQSRCVNMCRHSLQVRR